MKKVMLVDDDVMALETLEETVLLTGREVISKASNGKEALEKFNANCVDLVLLDMHLPDMKGYEVAREMKKRSKEVGRKVIIVFIFSPKGCGSLDSLLNVCDAILLKPYSLDVLLGIISC